MSLNFWYPCIFLPSAVVTDVYQKGPILNGAEDGTQGFITSRQSSTACPSYVLLVASVCLLGI